MRDLGEITDNIFTEEHRGAKIFSTESVVPIVHSLLASLAFTGTTEVFNWAQICDLAVGEGHVVVVVDVVMVVVVVV